MTEITARASVPRTGSALLSRLLWCLAALLALCQTIIWLEPEKAELALLEQFAVQLGGLAAIGAALALVSRRWLRALLFAALTVTLSWPVFADRGQAPAVAGGERLKVLSANLWYHATGHQRTVDALMASDADIIGLVEMRQEWRRALAPLIAKYPYHVDCFDADPFCETMVLSKLPIVRPHAGRVFRTTPMVAGGEVDWNGRRFTVLASHLIWPLSESDDSIWGEADPARAAYLPGPLPANRQAAQAGNLAKFINTLPPDVLVMGDFNSASWGRVQQSFRRATRLDNRAGWDLTWPSWLPWPLRLPLDHILARGHLVVTEFAAASATDSDHLPVMAEIGWRD